jgi:hypothetical protein
MGSAHKMHRTIDRSVVLFSFMWKWYAVEAIAVTRYIEQAIAVSMYLSLHPFWITLSKRSQQQGNFNII